MLYKVGLLEKKIYRKKAVAELFFLIKLHTIKPATLLKGTSAQMFYSEFCEKLLKALGRTPPVSASNFNSTILTLRPRKMDIYVFPALHFYIFLSYFMFFIEARNKFVWFYTKFWVKQAVFDVLIYYFSAAQQTSTAKLPDSFS